MQKMCNVCGATIEELDGQCAFSVPEEIAPWLDDYKAMNLGLMSHTEHQAIVARWTLHHSQGKSDKVLGKYAEIVRLYWGETLILARDLPGVVE